MHKRYHVALSETDRRSLQKLVRSGTAPARALTHARILLKADAAEGGPGWQDEQIAEAVEVSVPTVACTRRRFIQGGLDDALYHRPPSKTKRKKLDGHAEAHLVKPSLSGAAHRRSLSAEMWIRSRATPPTRWALRYE